MIEFLIQRAFVSLVTLFVITVVVFTGVRLIPGDPARVMAGTDADEAGLEEIRQKYGLTDPIPLQYLRWLGLTLRGDLGESIRSREGVARTVALKLPITLQLAAYSLAVALLIAVPAGVLAAVRRNTTGDFPASGVSLCGVSIPNSWLGIMLILFFSVHPGWLSASGYVSPTPDLLGNTQRMLMPSVVLGTDSRLTPRVPTPQYPRRGTCLLSAGSLENGLRTALTGRQAGARGKARRHRPRRRRRSRAAVARRLALRGRPGTAPVLGGGVRRWRGAPS